ncbi:MAG TPA: hypothetical protein VHH72_04330 [Solirubrobacterales bacterium]|nr:hypothetical protein [Solirubrobacterales bacterium]
MRSRTFFSRVRSTGKTTVGLALLLALCAGLVQAGCGGDGNGTAETRSGTIPQPAVDDPRVAPESRRVDLEVPTFSNPTEVTNSLFPVSKQESVLLLGQVDGEPFRTEVTLLPETRIIEWEGQRVEVLVSQYVAFLSGRLHEVAYDFYAQDDSGAVWYFGEDVFNFRDGVIVDTHGTWIASKDGPAAMIMPADPQVGQVYRPENIPGFVFEEVTVKAVDKTLQGPLGPVEGGLEIRELHLLDSARETKTFGPGYGEFLTGGAGDVEAISLAVPTDRLDGPTPAELEALAAGAERIYGAGQLGSSAKGTIARMGDAWKTVQAGQVPDNIEPLMSASLRRLRRAVDAGEQAKASQAAIDVAQSAYDLQLRHRPATEVDFARFQLWLAQLGLDAKAGDPALVNGDFFTIDYLRDRIQHTIAEPDRVEVNTLLEELNGAVGDEDLGAAAETAQQLRDLTAGIQQAG